MMNLKILIPAVCLLLPFITDAQQTMIYKDPEAAYQQGLEMFAKEKYAAAGEIFSVLSETLPAEYPGMKANSDYYAALCAFELFNNDAEYRFRKFIAENQENTKIREASFQLGKVEYRRKNYAKAAAAFELVDTYDLSAEQLPEYYFKLGYSYLMENNTEKANQAFFEILKDSTSQYYAPVTYYYAHIAYNNKQYQMALDGFSKLKEDPTFKALIPYYLTQIYYLQGRYDDVIRTAPPLVESGTSGRIPEIARLVGEAYYRKEMYREALPYLQIYQQKSRSGLNKEDNYQLAYACYKTGDFKQAIGFFEKATASGDSLAQNAWYHLGDCYLKTGQKPFARNAFLAAHKMTFDPQIKEDALFNYAKLAIELTYNPYNEAILALKQYVTEYPASERIDEAYSYLVNLFLSTRNYKDALESMEVIRNKNEKLKAAYQKILYYRGVELFNSKKYTDATDLFRKSQNFEYDLAIRAQSTYWIGEAYYRLKDFDKAIRYYTEFQTKTGANRLSIYPLSSYNLGYCHYKKKDYEKAIYAFRKYVTDQPSGNPEMLADAYLRMGDCFFISKKYTEAVDNYNQTISLKGSDTDYALFQKGLALGVTGKYDEKISTLNTLQKSFPKSPYLDDAAYELGITYLAKNDNTRAAENFRMIVEEFPKSSYTSKALLKLGLIDFTVDRNEAALLSLKRVVSDYPGSLESREALESIRNIYVDMNNVDDFFVYVKQLSLGNVSNTEQDSLTYIASENQYMKGDCNASLKGFTSYLEKFPEGIFALNANYYKGDCEFKSDHFDEALKNFSYVISKPFSKFTENSLLKTTYILMSRKNYSEALKNYIALEKTAEYPDNVAEAITGQMRCNFFLNNFQAALHDAARVMADEKSSPDLMVEAHFLSAQSALALDSITLAQAEFERTVKLSQGEKGAESKYYLAQIQFRLGNNTESEKIVFELINQYPSYDYWVAKGFILLADIYVKNGNSFQARQTLQSIIDNYEGADLVKLAHEKQNAILEAEKQEQLKKLETKDKQIDNEGDDSILK